MFKLSLLYLVWSMLCFLLLAQIACQIQKEQIASNDLPKNDSNLNKLPVNNVEQMTNDERVSPPISISKVRRKNGKPPLQIYSFDLEVKSRRDEYTWLLMQYDLDKPLNETGTFTAVENIKVSIGAIEFPGKQNQEKVVVVRFLGEADFRAIRPAIQGTIKFSPLVLNSNSDVSVFEVWEVRSLLVNGKTPLEEWFPYDTESTATKRPLNDQSYDRKVLNLDGNTNTEGVDYPKEEVKFIVAQGVRKWRIPFKVSIDNSK